MIENFLQLLKSHNYTPGYLSLEEILIAVLIAMAFIVLIVIRNIRLAALHSHEKPYTTSWSPGPAWNDLDNAL